MRRYTKLISWLLILAMCLAVFTACGSKTAEPEAPAEPAEESGAASEEWNRTVATFGDHTLTSAMFSYFYWASYTSFLNYYGSEAQNIVDLYTPLSEQMYSEDVTWQDYFIDNAFMAYRQYCVLNDMAEADGFELSETAQNTLANAENELQEVAETMGFETIEEYLVANYGGGSTFENYMEYIHDHFVVQEYTAQLQNSFNYTDEEVEAFFDEHAAEYAEKGVEKIDVNMAQLRYLMILPADDSEESYTAIDTAFDEMLADWENWEDKSEEGFMSFGEKWSEQGFAQDYLDAVAPGTISFSYFDDWTFGEPRTLGDTRTYYMQSGDYMFFYVGQTDEVYWRSQARYDMSYDAFTSFMLEKIDAYEFETFPENIIIAQSADLYDDTYLEDIEAESEVGATEVLPEE